MDNPFQRVLSCIPPMYGELWERERRNTSWNRPAYAPAGPILTEVAPFIAVISSGVDNRYGHPHPAVLGRLSDAGAAVLRTDELGTIEVVTDGEQIWWESHQ